MLGILVGAVVGSAPTLVRRNFGKAGVTFPQLVPIYRDDSIHGGRNMKGTPRTLAVMLLALAPLYQASAAERFTCNLGLLTKAELKRDQELARLMRTALVERKELPNGYGFRFTAQSTQQLAEWTYIIAKCCQPLDYRFEIGPQPGGALWLWMTGGDGVKEFIGGEFEGLLSKEIPK